MYAAMCANESATFSIVARAFWSVPLIRLRSDLLGQVEPLHGSPGQCHLLMSGVPGPIVQSTYESPPRLRCELHHSNHALVRRGTEFAQLDRQVHRLDARGVIRQ